MKSLVLLAALFAPASAHADATAYYDVAKVRAECSECKAANQALKADETKWNDEIGRAKDQRRQQLLAQYQQEDQQRAARNSQRTDARVKRILPALAKARHLTAVLAIGDGNYAAPQVDLTTEIVRRLDAGEGKGEDELRAELAKARAELAAATAAKPEPPKK